MGETYGGTCTDDQYWCMMAANSFVPPTQYIGCYSDQQHCKNHQQSTVDGTICQHLSDYATYGDVQNEIEIKVTPLYSVYNKSTIYELWDLNGPILGDCQPTDWVQTQCFSDQDSCNTKCKKLHEDNIKCKCDYMTSQCGSYYYLQNEGSSNFVAKVVGSVFAAVVGVIGASANLFLDTVDAATGGDVEMQTFLYKATSTIDGDEWEDVDLGDSPTMVPAFEMTAEEAEAAGLVLMF